MDVSVVSTKLNLSSPAQYLMTLSVLVGFVLYVVSNILEARPGLASLYGTIQILKLTRIARVKKKMFF